jgi:protein TonB
MLRLPATILGGVVVTFGLFLLMHYLILVTDTRLGDEGSGSIIDFVRLREESQVQEKKRELPKKVEQEKPPPPPDIDMNQSARPQLGSGAGGSVQIPTFDYAGAGGVGAVASDMDVIPLVRIPHNYPRRAQQMGISGWVYLRFTITPAGTVTDIEVVDAEPQGTFDREARRAVSKYKYKPKIVDGVAVARQGVEIVLEWNIEE